MNVALSLRPSFEMSRSIKLDFTLVGDLVQSLFPRTVNLLRGTDYQRALKLVASRRRMKLYHDLVDLLFCELFTDYKEYCLGYYAGEEPPLREHPAATRAQIQEWDIFLVAALNMAHEAMQRHHQINWRTLSRMTKRALQEPS